MNPFHKPIQKLGEIWGAQRGLRARVMLYHSISDSPGDPFAVSPDLFRSQMTWLYENEFQVVSSRELLFAIQQHEDLRHTIVITFDDAFCDFFDTALPVLKEFNYPAVIFVPTGRIGQIGDWGRNSSNRPIMDEQQLIRIARSGFELGSHSVTHARLRDLSQEALISELQESLDYISKLTGQKSIPLAYPYGSCGAREQAEARSAGYACAYLAGGLWGIGKGSNLFALPREEINRKTSIRDFSISAAGKIDFQRIWNEFTIHDHSAR